MDANMVAAIGMGNMIQVFFVITAYKGFNGTIQILVSQTSGAGNIEQCGVYLN